MACRPEDFNPEHPRLMPASVPLQVMNFSMGNLSASLSLAHWSVTATSPTCPVSRVKQGQSGEGNPSLCQSLRQHRISKAATNLSSDMSRLLELTSFTQKWTKLPELFWEAFNSYLTKTIAEIIHAQENGILPNIKCYCFYSCFGKNNNNQA